MQEKEADPAALWPIEVHLSSDKRVLSLHYEGGQVRALEAEYLRVESPSAEVRGHHPSERKTVSGKRNVTMVALEPVGHYAIRIRFSDGHDTGLYAWSYLAELADEHEAHWQAYLEALADKGLTRD
jgi:DUF971 family protein